jgi:iron-sulfur cluster assembly protein
MTTFDITLSDKAKKHYLKWLEKHPEALGVRLFTKRAGCSGLMYQSELVEALSAQDHLAFEEGRLKVFIPESAAPYLKGIEVDVESQWLGQSQVVYRNPNEVARCGCGESFKVKD